MNKKYYIDDIKLLIKDKPYRMLEDTFTTIRNGFSATTDDGYIVVLKRDNIFNNKSPEIFHICNPYTINNINNYLKINNISTKLISKTYQGNSKKLLWECSCGRQFERNWNNFLNGSICCTKCSLERKGKESRISYTEVLEKVRQNGYYLVSSEFKEPISNKKISLYDKNGYYYETLWSDLKKGKKPKMFHPCNKYTIQNINNYLKINRNNEYECISKKYINNTTDLLFRHKICNTLFNASFVEMKGKMSQNNKDLYYKKCPNCNTAKTESNHASILKQVFLHEYPDTITEDRTCINPKTNHCLPTDIVNHRLKIAIEIQSSFHDCAERKWVDNYKKNFWIKLGYNFYDPDIREYSILDMIQLFFPFISSIPNYVDYNFSNCVDFVKVQSMLDNGYSIKEISNILDVKTTTIRGLITSKKIQLPNEYKNKVFKIKPIIRLSKNGSFIERFESLCDADKKGFAPGTIRRVLNKQQDFSYDSFWVYEEDYKNNNYIIPEIKKDKFNMSVDKYDKNNNFICHYESIYKAEKNSKSSKSEIYRVANGERKSSRGEKRKFYNLINN